MKIVFDDEIEEEQTFKNLDEEVFENILKHAKKVIEEDDKRMDH